MASRAPCTPRAAAAQRVRSSLETEVFTPSPGHPAGVTISIGVTEYEPLEDMTTFIRRADEAMYLSKQNGRNRVSVLFAGTPRVTESSS